MFLENTGQPSDGAEVHRDLDETGDQAPSTTEGYITFVGRDDDVISRAATIDRARSRMPDQASAVALAAVIRQALTAAHRDLRRLSC